MRSIRQVGAAAVCLLLGSIPCAAQGSAFGLGARLSMMRTDAHADLDPVRFTGGQMRIRSSPRTGFEVSLDVHSESNDALNRRVRDVPLQASMLLFPIQGAFSPYILGGPGWYSHRVQSLVGGDVVNSETTRKFGWHGGFGAELRLGAHAGIHGDYRYTFLHFGSDDDDEDSGSRFMPKYDGSMWTAGVTVYF